MKILSFLNVSNRGRLDADSGFIIYNLLVDYFLAQGHSFIFVAPEPLDNLNCKHIPFEFGDNKYSVRFNFQWESIYNIIKQELPDVIIVNQIELMANYKSIIETLGIKTIIAGYTHYIPFGVDSDGKMIIDPTLNNGNIGKSIRLNFLSGLEASDVIFTHSNTSLNYIKNLYFKMGLEFPEHKFIINPPPKDPKLMKTDNQLCHSKEIIYNHRLYSHYGGAFFLEFVGSIIEKCDVNVKVFDILGKRSEERKRLDPSVEIIKEQLQSIKQVEIKTANRVEYVTEIKSARVAIAPYKNNAIWSMSCIDALSMGIPVVAPSFAWFDEFIPDYLKFTSIEEAVSIAHKLLTDDMFWKASSEEAVKLTEHLSPDIIATKFLETFNHLLNN